MNDICKTGSSEKIEQFINNIKFEIGQDVFYFYIEYPENYFDINFEAKIILRRGIIKGINIDEKNLYNIDGLFIKEDYVFVNKDEILEIFNKLKLIADNYNKVRLEEIKYDNERGRKWEKV